MINKKLNNAEVRMKKSSILMSEVGKAGAIGNKKSSILRSEVGRAGATGSACTNKFSFSKCMSKYNGYKNSNLKKFTLFMAVALALLFMISAPIQINEVKFNNG